MKENAEQMVRELAEKLNTTVEHLWGVLLAQAPISAAAHALLTVLMLASFWAGYRLVERKTKTPVCLVTERQRYAEWEGNDAGYAWFFLALYGGVTVWVTGATILLVLTAMFNPEYWALKQILP